MTTSELNDNVCLSEYYCLKCGKPVECVDGQWQCDCQAVGAHEVEIGYHELPVDWICL